MLRCSKHVIVPNGSGKSTISEDWDCYAFCDCLGYLEAGHKGLVTNYGEGGLQNGRGGHVKFYPYEKGWRKKI